MYADSPLHWLSLFNLYIHEKTSSAYSLPEFFSIQAKIFFWQSTEVLLIQGKVNSHFINSTDCAYLPGPK